MRSSKTRQQCGKRIPCCWKHCGLMGACFSSLFSLRSKVASMSCFFFNDTATTEIYTLSLHDALPIWLKALVAPHSHDAAVSMDSEHGRDRKSTRLNSSHVAISYAVFCLKKKKKT